MVAAVGLLVLLVVVVATPAPGGHWVSPKSLRQTVAQTGLCSETQQDPW